MKTNTFITICSAAMLCMFALALVTPSPEDSPPVSIDTKVNKPVVKVRQPTRPHQEKPDEVRHVWFTEVNTGFVSPQDWGQLNPDSEK